MSIFTTHFDSEVAYSYFLTYQETNSDKELNSLLIAIAPLIGYVGRVFFNTIPPFELEFLSSDILGNLYIVFISKKISSNSPGNFTGVCFSIIKNTMYSLLKKEDKQGRCDVGYMVHNSLLYSHSDVLNKIYLDQCLSLVMALVDAEVRFKGKDKEACLFVANCIVHGRENEIQKGRVRYNIKKSKYIYLVNYTRLLLKDMFVYVKQLTEEN